MRVLDHVHVRQHDETLIDHLLQHRQIRPELRFLVDDRQDDRQIAREAQPLLLVEPPVGAIAGNPPVHRDARDVVRAKALDDCLVERLPLPPVALADEDTQRTFRAAPSARHEEDVSAPSGPMAAAQRASRPSCPGCRPAPSRPSRGVWGRIVSTLPDASTNSTLMGRFSLSSRILAVCIRWCEPKPATPLVTVAPDTP